MLLGIIIMILMLAAYLSGFEDGKRDVRRHG